MVIDEKAAFIAALALCDAEEREAYLQEACSGRPELLGRLRELLSAHEESQGPLDRRPAATVDQPAGEGPGTVIGTYKLLEQIGEGGFGAVFLAEQTQPVRRKVALKILKPGMDTRQVVARFEAERQALAIMDHPNIAKVHDGGVTPSGRPYFVMELVKGTPITEFCDHNHLTLRERLELFVQVCGAVQHAHQKGIIHRDLKPSNVLVSRHDTVPVVKVIDFGVAKALGQELTDKTLFTGVAQMIGTPLYMSPEQAGMSDLDVDTRSDIYSLGVLLYELLTGTTPFAAGRFRTIGYDEIRRIIREEEPPRPSTRLSESKDALPSISAQRHTEPAKLTRLVRGELDWIVMKALEKDRNRRYETANGFAADAQRYLADEPVHAVPPSAGYRFRKFARRNKRVLVTAAVLGVALLLAVGSLGWVVRDREAGRVRTTAEVNQFLERAEVLYAENKLPEAVAEVQKARGVLEAGRGDEELGRRVQQWLTDLDTAAKLEEIQLAWSELEDRERVLADYAQVFREYGIDADALSVGEASARVATSPIKLDLVLALSSWSRTLRSDPRLQDPAHWQRLKAIARAADPDPWRQRVDAAYDAKDLRTLRELADGADPGQFRIRTLEVLGHSLRVAGDAEAGAAFLRRVQRQHPGAFSINSALAACLEQSKEPPLDELIAFRRAALAVRPRSAWAHLALGVALWKKQRLDEAIIECREAVRLRPGFARAHNILGGILKDQKKLDEAAAEYRKAIDSDPNYAPAHTNLGNALRDQKKLDEAVACFKRAIELDPKSAFVHTNLGNALHDQKKLDEATACYKKALDIDPKYVWAHYNLGNVRTDQKKLDEAIACYKKAIELDPNYAVAHSGLGLALHNQKKLDEAVAAFHKAIELDPNYAVAHTNLGTVLAEQKKPDEAVACWRKAIEVDPNAAAAHHNLGRALHDQKKLDEAVACYKKAIELDPNDAFAYTNLGLTLRDQKKLDEAVAAFRKAIERDPAGTAFLNHGVAHSNLGLALTDQKKFDEAIAAYREAIRLQPDHASSYSGLGHALSGQKKLDEAIAAYRKAVELDPKNATYHNNLGVELHDQNKSDEALACYKKAIELDPKYAAPHTNLGNVLREQKKLDEAVASCKKAIELDPTYAGHYYSLGDALREQKKLDETVASYKKAIELDPKHARAHNNLGLALAAQNKPDEAVAAYREAIAIDPKLAIAHRNLARAFVAQNKLDEAVAAFREAIRVQPEHADAHNSLGALLSKQGKLDEAIAAFREAIRLKPDYSSAHYNLGLALQRRGKVDDAITAYRECIRLDPNFAPARFNLAEALLRKGRLDDAIATYEALIRVKPDDADAHNSLGWTLAAMGRVEEAIAAYEEAIRLKADYLQPHGNLAWLLTAGPDPKCWDGKRALELLNKIETQGGKNDFSRKIVGLAHYRAGNWKEALAALEEAMKLAKGGDGSHWFGLALAHQRLGNTAEARAWYGKAVEWMDKNKPADKTGELRRLRAEAAKLLGVAVEVAPPPREKK